MTKAVGIIGYKNSGKTTLTRALARELIQRHYSVAVVKHSSHHLDLNEKDTATLGEIVEQVGFLSPKDSAVLWKKPLSLEDLLPHLTAEMIMIEGLKEERTLPKIVCLRGKPDDRDLFDGLAIAAVGPPDQVKDIGVPLLDRDAVEQIADLVEQRAFKLPNLDCGGCGHETCYDLAQEIVSGKSSVADCVSLQPDVTVTVDGKPLPLNPFIANLIRGATLGLLSQLTGFRRGDIEIQL